MSRIFSLLNETLPLLNFQLRVEQSNTAGPAFKSNSLSGNERNRLLLAGAHGFIDNSLISGIDCKEDARSFALFDYDHDGWLDIALASPNAPRLRIFRNKLGELGNGGRMIRIKLTGTESNRDACGTLVTIKTNKRIRTLQKTIGEGLSSQNSSTLYFSLAVNETLESITVRWPSGKISNHTVDGTRPLIDLIE
ncbi:ASPIC/UnbV domain-containing protein [Akkermansiaceae bacterium]|nr:ASPIC/UnbV domain-containing protein [Akkermansiaceae bacterium]